MIGDAYNKSVYICLLCFLKQFVALCVWFYLFLECRLLVWQPMYSYLENLCIYAVLRSAAIDGGPTMGASKNTWKNGWYSYMLAFRVSVFCWSILFLLNLLSDSLLGTGFDQPACPYKCTSVLALNEFLKKKCILCLFQYLI